MEHRVDGAAAEEGHGSTGCERKRVGVVFQQHRAFFLHAYHMRFEILEHLFAAVVFAGIVVRIVGYLHGGRFHAEYAVDIADAHKCEIAEEDNETEYKQKRRRQSSP